MTDFTLRLVMIRALLISFIAKYCLAFLRSTRHTFPKPPLPIQLWYTKFCLCTAAQKKSINLVRNYLRIHSLMLFDSKLDFKSGHKAANMWRIRQSLWFKRSSFESILTLEVIWVEIRRLQIRVPHDFEWKQIYCFNRRSTMLDV